MEKGLDLYVLRRYEYLPFLEIKMTVFDEALALEITEGKITWKPNTNFRK